MTAFGLIVGINEYGDKSKLRTLAGAVADAAAFADWALHKSGGKVDPEHLFFWTWPAPSQPTKAVRDYLKSPTPWPDMDELPDLNRAPTATEICTAVQFIADAALTAEASRLYVYFAGHGFQTKPRNFSEPAQACFVAGDYDPRIAAAGLVPLDDMSRMLKIAGPPEIVVFVDACRNEASPRVPAPRGPWNVTSDQGIHERLCTGRAAQEEKVAYEVPFDSPARGAFTSLLVNGLRKHRVNNQLMLEDLENFVAEGIASLVSPNDQYPDFDERPKPRKIVLGEGPPIGDAPTVVIQVKIKPAPALILIGGESSAKVQLAAGKSVHPLNLDPGAYVIESTDGEQLTAFLHTGEETMHVEV